MSNHQSSLAGRAVATLKKTWISQERSAKEEERGSCDAFTLICKEALRVTSPGQPKLSRRAFLGTSAAAAALAMPERAKAEEERSPSPETLRAVAAQAIQSNISLEMIGEGGAYFGSATLIKPPPAIRHFLRPGEFFAVSATHNFWGWSSDTDRLVARVFTHFTEGLHPREFHKLSARLIGRFTDGDVGREDGYADVALVAVQVPLKTVSGKSNPLIKHVESVLMDVADQSTELQLGQHLVSVGCPAVRNGQPFMPPRGGGTDGKFLPQPAWRSGQMIVANDETSLSTYGAVSHTTLVTTVPNQSGDSGGALVDLSGRLVGITSSRVEVGLNHVDVQPPQFNELLSSGAVVVSSQADVDREIAKLSRREYGFAMDVRERGIYESVSSLHMLVEFLRNDHEQLVAERLKIQEQLRVVKERFSASEIGSDANRAILSVFDDKLAEIEAKIRRFMP